MGSVDPVLEDHEKRAGKVSLSEVEKWLADYDAQLLKTTGAKSEWFSTTQEQLQVLDAMIALAAGSESEKAATYICEVAWSSLGLPETDGASVEYNIRCEVPVKEPERYFASPY